jgi:hypothetical protein
MEQNLNTINYPRQVIEIFVLAIGHDMNLHANI